MLNIIFDASTGSKIRLSDDLDEAYDQKRVLERDCDHMLLWVTYSYRPVFSSRGEYLGYTTGHDFEEMI